MHTVGIRELKAQLSRHLKRVRAGARLVVTERGRAIASIQPIPTGRDTRDTEWAHAWVASGGAHWSGGKPTGATPPVPITKGRSVSAAVLEDRR
jgi:prevent-host-death family protein